MEISNLEAIESLGQLLSYYKSDLEYIAKFKLFKTRVIADNEYLNGDHGFQKFINEFRVARCIKKLEVPKLMAFARVSKLIDDPEAVDNFAEKIEKEGFTHQGKTMTSLASKIFFLNQPLNIIPMDSLNQIPFELKENNYGQFKDKIEDFINNNRPTLCGYLSTIEDHLTRIESSLDIKLDFRKYRMNRFTDKYLWVKGKKLSQIPADKRLNS